MTKPAPDNTQRIQKLLANLGLGSRREIDAWVSEGRIKVNGRQAQPGQMISLKDSITLNGRRVQLPQQVYETCEVMLYHKPEGEVCSRDDPEGRPNVFRKLPRPQYGRWISVGRLDINTSGLLLLTTDGELARRLMHPSYEVERVYAVRALGELDAEARKALLEGVMLEDGVASFSQLQDAGGEGANRWYHVSLGEGRNREVRRLWEAVGLTVSRLTRLRYGPVELPRDLPRGRCRPLDLKQVNGLRQAVGMDKLDKNQLPPPRKKLVSKGRKSQPAARVAAGRAERGTRNSNGANRKRTTGKRPSGGRR